MPNHLQPHINASFSAMPFTQAFLNLPSDAAQAAYLLKRLLPEQERLLTNPKPNERSIFSLCERKDDLAQAEALTRQWKAKGCQDLVVIGSGGSGLSGKALSYINGRTRKRLHVLDNLDVHALEALLEQVELQETAVFIVSKSGGTSETHAYADALFAAMRADGAMADIAERAAVMAMEGDNAANRLASRYGLPTIAHDPALGGRFSLLSPVGIVPAAFLGLDVRALRQGAAAVLSDMEPAMRAAVWNMEAMQEGKNIAVMMPYAESLWGITLWWRQVWAESLGKEGLGSTPYASIGTSDQHSQLQLYLGGPKDKAYTLLLPETKGKGPMIANDCALSMLKHKNFGDVTDAMQRATAETLRKIGAPLRILHLPRTDEEAIGALSMQFTLEVIFTAALLGVDPFDQPAVEESKVLIKSYLSA